MTEKEPLKEGWGLPLLSTRAHYFLDEISLCRHWMYKGELENKNNESPDNCKLCMKQRLRRENMFKELNEKSGVI